MFSPRRRRQSFRVAAAVGAAMAAAVVVVLLPARAPSRRDALRPGAPQIVRTPRTVPVTPGRRRAINAVLDRFIPSALPRRHLAVAHGLVTSSFAAGVSESQWRRGELPVFPYKPRDTRFHGWKLLYSYPDEVSLDVLVHPSASEQLGAIGFTAVLKRRGGRWLVDAFVPAAMFAAEKKKPQILAQPDFQPNPAGGTTHKSALSATWLLFPAALLALIALVPAIVVARTKLADRQAMRTYRGLYEKIT